MSQSPVVNCLIVDDLEDNLIALEALLAEPGLRILRARSGAEALELLLVHPVALALLDVQMPEIDGFELAELMRGSERTRHIPIIFVTAGLGDQRRVFKGYESGAVDFLLKPIEPQVLKSKARVFFQLHRQSLQIAEELRERTETLRMNELFTAMLGHDLRGPLSAIVMASMIIERKSTDEGLRKMATRSLSSARSMSRMIEDMLDLARARIGGGIVVRRVRGDLAAPMHRVADECAAAHPQGRLEWRVDGDCTGEWDVDRLAQVASNLIGNAFRHGTPGEPVLVRLDGRADDEVVFSVENGGRIAAEVLPRLFDPFRGREEPSSRGEGLGIGLYIVRQIVTAHGGRVDASSNDGERTVFTVRLPRRGEAAAAADAR
ncbi:MAG TPA: hybrid sensor histidine kinase/response regulator [Caldimonas sp.]|nr:hybrid sensor histidine kinase/response regulator [Caldimonas sp.]